MNPYVEVNHLKKEFILEKNILGRPVKTLKAVDDVSFHINQYETLGVVGESGCGKSTTGRCILRLTEPTEGEVKVGGTVIGDLSAGELRAFRKKMQIVFQDPMSSFDPKYTIEKTLLEPLKLHHICEPIEYRDTIEQLLERVGIPKKNLTRFPHELSGGQRQRIGIARALAVNPEFVICDEPVSALDVSIQSQILNLFLDLQEQLGLTYMFISHDLSVVRFVCTSICVMYLGRVVEYGETEEIFKHPLHPYTEALMSAIPASHPSNRGKRITLSGDVSHSAEMVQGCHFYSRCPYASDMCRQVRPELKKVRDGHYVACHL